MDARDLFLTEKRNVSVLVLTDKRNERKRSLVNGQEEWTQGISF
jgi:hypothetical protein